VVKVEPPGGDDFRSLLDGSMFAAFNMGEKQSLCLDLKTEDGRAGAQALATEVDVVIESFRPGVVDQFGLDYETIQADNEDVIYCSITGFGDDGPYSDWPAYDPVLQAMSGLMSTVGYPDRPPVRIGASIIDCATGMTAAFAIAAALLDRRQGGGGNRLEVALFDVAVSWMGYWIANYSATNTTPGQSRRGGFAGLTPNGAFPTGDDKLIYISVVNDAQFERLCGAIGEDALAEDTRFAESRARWEHREVLYDALTTAFDAYARSTLVELLTEAGVPAGPVNEIDDVVGDAHVAARNLLTESRNLQRGETVETAGVPFVTAAGRPEMSGTPPNVGEHTRAVLEELGYSEERINRMVAAGAAYEE
jgi:crotonobetainyl-CoA:carnitine CoA-transferase CaiB-like acyl-CoA transferase